MSIIGIGIDIVKISRIKKIIKNFGDKFAKKILSKKEWKKYLINRDNVYFLAKRFSAKEAAYKALGISQHHQIKFSQLEIYHQSGKPNLRFLDNALKASQKIQCKSIYLSISDEKSYACAIVILEN